MADHQKYKDEQRRQTNIICEAMTDAMTNCHKQFEAPMINAVIGALVGIEVTILSSISDGRARKAMIETMEKERRIALRHALKKTKTMNIETVVLGGNN